MRVTTPDIYVSEFGREDTPERIISLHESYRGEIDKSPPRRSLYVPTAETALLSNDNRGSYLALPTNAGAGVSRINSSELVRPKTKKNILSYIFHAGD
jgi:hypothetical protein